MERNIYFNYLRSWTANSDGTRNTDQFKIGYQEQPTIKFTVFSDDDGTAKDLSDAVAWELCIAKDFAHGTPMSRVLDADIDDSAKATGIISANVATATATFLAAVGTAKSIPAYLRLKGLDGSGNVVFKILIDIVAENDPDPAGGTPPDPIGDYYNKTEVDALQSGKMALVSTPTNGHIITTNGSGQGVDSGTALASVMTNPMTTAADIIVGGTAGAPARLAKGTGSQVLRMNSGATAQEYATLTTADIADSTDKRYVSDAQKVVIGNTSGTNTGDQTNIAGNAATATKLATARKINGVDFDGSAAINGNNVNYHGVSAIGAVTFNATDHILSVASITYYFNGTSYTTASPVTCDIDSFETLTTNTLYYFYFDDATGTLKCADTVWNLKTTVPVATVFWNGTTGAIQQEWHNHTRDIDWHINAHLTIGARYQSGFVHTYPDASNDASLQIEAGTLYDEDLAITTTQQTTCRVIYKASANVYTYADSSLPYAGTSGQPQFLDTDSYTLANVDAAKYVCMWVYGTPDTSRPIWIIPTHAATDYNTIALARAETAPNLSGLNLNPEMKLLYRWIYKGDGNYQEATDYRTSASLPSGGSSPISANEVTFVPYSTIASTNVQSALQELVDEVLVNPMTTAEDIIIGGTAGAPTRKAKGADGTFLGVSGGALTWSTPAGDVVGPASNTDNYVPLWNGADSKALKNGLATGNASGAIVLRSDTNDISADAIAEVTSANGVAVDGLTIKDAGFAIGSDADGDIYYRASGALARLAKGTAEQALKMNSGATAPEWGRVMNPKRHVWIDAGAMIARTTNGAASATVESSTNKQMSDFFDFDKDADENVCFRWAFPDVWDRSTVKVKFYWSASAGTSGTVKWYIQGVAISNDDAIDASYGTAVGVEDTFIATGDVHVTSATGAVTIGGTPAVADVCYFQIYRDVSEDTFDADARLMGVMIEYGEATTDATAW